MVAVFRFVEPQLSSLIIHLQLSLQFECCVSFEFLLVFFVSQAGISLLGEVNWIVTTVDNQRSCGAKIAGFELLT